MGNRALVVFRSADRSEVSPTVYLHWNGSEVPALIEKLSKLMSDRRNDVDYATARFIGLCHELIPGNLGLGVWNNTPEFQSAIRTNDVRAIREYSHGDAGVVVVDVADFSWVAYGGYLRHSDTE